MNCQSIFEEWKFMYMKPWRPFTLQHNDVVMSPTHCLLSDCPKKKKTLNEPVNLCLVCLTQAGWQVCVAVPGWRHWWLPLEPEAETRIRYGSKEGWRNRDLLLLMGHLNSSSLLVYDTKQLNSPFNNSPWNFNFISLWATTWWPSDTCLNPGGSQPPPGQTAPDNMAVSGIKALQHTTACFVCSSQIGFHIINIYSFCSVVGLIHVDSRISECQEIKNNKWARSLNKYLHHASV